MKLTLLGTGGAIPTGERVNTSTLVTADKRILFDCGSGVLHRLLNSGTSVHDLDALFFTHFHADHCSDLANLLVARYCDERKPSPLEIYGPPGTSDYVETILNRTFPYIRGLSKAISGSEFRLAVTEISTGSAIHLGTLSVCAAEARHGVPAYSYRLTATDCTAFLSGDTEFVTEMPRFARGAAIALYACSFPPAFGRVPGHTTPAEIGRFAAEAQVKLVVLNHLFREATDSIDAVLSEIRQHYSGPVEVGTDLRTFEL